MIRKINISTGMKFYYKLLTMAKFMPELEVDRDAGTVHFMGIKPILLCDIAKYRLAVLVSEHVYANVTKTLTTTSRLSLARDGALILATDAAIKMGVYRND